MSVNPKDVVKAVKALLQFIDTQAKKKSAAATAKQLIEEEQEISLIIALKKIPEKGTVKPIRIPLTHSLYDDGQQICLFTKDPQREYKDKLEATPVEGVARVIGVSKLRSKFKQYKDRRELLHTYDLFLTDDRILPLLPPLLGKKFFDKKKQPVPVCLSRANIKAELEQARDATYLHLKQGACSAVRVGRSSFSAKKLAANINGCIPHIVDKIPRKWKNIQAIYVKSTDSIALPLYASLPEQTRVLAGDDDDAAVGSKRKRGASNDDDDDDDDDDADAKTPQPVTPVAKKSKKNSKSAVKSTPAAVAATTAGSTKKSGGKTAKTAKKATTSKSKSSAGSKSARKSR